MEDSVRLDIAGRRLDRAVTVVGHAPSGDGRLARQTMKRYRRWQAEADNWRLHSGLAMPWTSDTLATYAAHLLQQGYARKTAELRLAAVKALHRERGEPVPDGVAAWYVLRGADDTRISVRREDPVPARRAALSAVARVCDLGRAAGARDLCLVTLAWDLLLGEYALVALDIADVRDEESGLSVRVRGQWRPVAHDHDPPEICPVEAAGLWLAVLAESGARAGPLFRSIDKAGNIAGCAPKAGPSGPGGRLTATGLEGIWKRILVRAGLPPSTPRVLKLGGAADDVAAGDSVAAVLARGGWSPNTAPAVRRLAEEADRRATTTDGEGTPC